MEEVSIPKISYRPFVCSYGFLVIFTSELCGLPQNTVSPLLRAIFRCLSARVLGPVLDKNFRSFRYSIGWFEVPVLDTFLRIFLCQNFEILDAIVTRSAEFWIFWFRCLGAFFSRCFE